jgi:hypothetical protein
MLQIREISCILSPDRPVHSHADCDTLAPMYEYVYMHMCTYIPMYYVFLYVYMHASFYVFMNIYTDGRMNYVRMQLHFCVNATS